MVSGQNLIHQSPEPIKLSIPRQNPCTIFPLAGGLSSSVCSSGRKKNMSQQHVRACRRARFIFNARNIRRISCGRPQVVHYCTYSVAVHYCCCFHIKPFFLPNDVPPVSFVDSSSQRQINSVVKDSKTEKPNVANQGGQIKCQRTGYESTTTKNTTGERGATNEILKGKKRQKSEMRKDSNDTNRKNTYMLSRKEVQS